MSRRNANGTRKEVKYRKIQRKDLVFAKEGSYGYGQFGEVKKAKWNGKEVAVKCFAAPDRKGGFSEELMCLSILKHTNIVEMYGAYTGERPFIVLEFAPLSLEKLLHTHRKKYKYTADHVMSWAQQISWGLEYIHRENMMHRDIKPSNILLFDCGRCLKLCDFGTTKTLESTLNTNAVGTIRYMAPEVIRGRKYTVGCDVFSFGMVVWEMITRKRPVLKNVTGERTSNNLSILYAMASGARPPSIKGLPRVIDEFINRCWDEDSSKRPSLVEITKKLDILCDRYFQTKQPLITKRVAQKEKPVSTEEESTEQEKDQAIVEKRTPLLSPGVNKGKQSSDGQHLGPGEKAASPAMREHSPDPQRKASLQRSTVSTSTEQQQSSHSGIQKATGIASRHSAADLQDHRSPPDWATSSNHTTGLAHGRSYSTNTRLDSLAPKQNPQTPGGGGHRLMGAQGYVGSSQPPYASQISSPPENPSSYSQRHQHLVGRGGFPPYFQRQYHPAYSHQASGEFGTLSISEEDMDQYQEKKFMEEEDFKKIEQHVKKQQLPAPGAAGGAKGAQLSYPPPIAGLSEQLQPIPPDETDPTSLEVYHEYRALAEQFVQMDIEHQDLVKERDRLEHEFTLINEKDQLMTEYQSLSQQLADLKVSPNKRTPPH